MSGRTRGPRSVWVLGWIALLVAACGQSEQSFRNVPPGGARPSGVFQVELVPGLEMVRSSMPNPYAGDIRATMEGERLYQWYNCVGCHFNGGGGIGPALMDGRWIYGGAADQIFATIFEGRPNGMPAFGRRIPDDQIWKIVAFVQTLEQAP